MAKLNLQSSKIKKGLTDVFSESIQKYDVSDIVKNGIGKLNSKMEKEFQEQINDLELRISKLESGQNFVSLKNDLEKIAMEFTSRFTDSLKGVLRSGLDGVDFDFTPVVLDIQEYIQDVFKDIQKQIPHQIPKEEALSIIQQNKYSKSLKNWLEEGSSGSTPFKNRKNFDEELKKNFELRNASLNAAYYRYMEDMSENITEDMLSFEEFLNQEVRFYRGAKNDQKYNSDRFISFSPYKEVSRGFAEEKGRSLYATSMKIRDTYGAPGGLFEEQGGELEFFLSPEDLLDEQKKLKETMRISISQGVKDGIHKGFTSVDNVVGGADILSEEYLDSLKQQAEKRIRLAKETAKQEEVIKANSIKKQQELEKEAEKQFDAEVEPAFFEDPRFKKAAEKYSFLNKIQTKDDEAFYFSGLNKDEADKIDELYDKNETFDLGVDSRSPDRGFISFETLNALLDETADKIDKVQKISEPELISSVEETVESQKKVKAAIEETIEATQKQSTVFPEPTKQEHMENVPVDDIKSDQISNLESPIKAEEIQKTIEEVNKLKEVIGDLQNVKSGNAAIEDMQQLSEETKNAIEVIKEQQKLLQSGKTGNTNTPPTLVDTYGKASQSQTKTDDTNTGPSPEELRKNALNELVKLEKEYYSILLKIDNASGNVKLAHEAQRDKIQANIDAIMKVYPGLDQEAFKDYDVSLVKAAYEDSLNVTPSAPVDDQEEKLKKLIKLMKEYYSLSVKAFGTTGNIETAYQTRLTDLDNQIKQADPALRAKALNNIEVSLPKAKYEDMLSTQTLQTYNEYLKLLREISVLKEDMSVLTVTKQETSALQQTISIREQELKLLEQKIKLNRQYLPLSDSEMQADQVNAQLTATDRANIFDTHYNTALNEYRNTGKQYYDSVSQLTNAYLSGAEESELDVLKNQAEALKKSLKEAENTYKNFVAYATSSSIQIDDQTQNIGESFKNYATQDYKKYKAQLKGFEEIASSKITDYNKQLDTLRKKLDALKNIEPEKSLDFDVVAQSVSKLKAEIEPLIKELSNKKYDSVTKNGEWVQSFDKNPLQSLADVENLIRSSSALNDSVKSIQKITLGKDMKSANVEILTQDGNLRKLKLTYDDTEQSLRKLVLGEQHYATLGEKFSDVLDNKILQMGAYFATTVSLYEIIDVFRMGTQYVTEFDSALKELQLASNASDNFLSDMTVSIQNLANSLASTNTEVAQSTTEWVKLGYSAQDSLDLAAASATYSRVGFTDIDTATTNLTSTIQAFKDSMSVGEDIGDFAEEIVDKFVNVGNTFASTAEGLGTALTDSASALVTAGNSLDEALALITAGNTITQDEPSVGAGLRTVSMRLRGTSASALIEAGEDTEGLIEDSAKLYATIKELTKTTTNPEGVSILTQTGDFRSTYQILLDISRVWDEINDKSKAAILEAIAGKNRANIVASILQTKDEYGNPLLETAYEASLNSGGASAKAMEITLSSVESAQKRMQNAWQTLFQNSDLERWLKIIYEIATGFLGVADNINLVEGALGALGGALVANKIVKLFDDAQKSAGNFFEALGQMASITGSKITKVAAIAKNAFIGAFAGWAVQQLINLAILGIDNLIHYSERAIEAANDLKNSYDETTNSIQSNIQTINSFSDRFNELSKGVSENGENISLSAEEYEEYKNIVSEIVQMQPSLAKNYQTENGYLIDKNTLLEEAIKLEEKQLLIEKAKQGNKENVNTLAKGARAEYKEDENVVDLAIENFAQTTGALLVNNLSPQEYKELPDQLSKFFNFDVREKYGQNITKLFNDYAFYIRDNYNDFISYIENLVSKEHRDTIYNMLFSLFQFEVPEYPTYVAETYFDSMVANFELASQDADAAQIANSFFNLLIEPFADYSFDDSAARTAIDSAVIEILELIQDEDGEISKAVQDLFSLDLESMTSDEAIAAISPIINAIRTALTTETLDVFGNVLTPESMYNLMGYDDYRSVEDRTVSRNEEIAKSSKDYNAELQKLNEFTANLQTNEKELWNSVTTGATSARQAIYLFTEAQKEADLATSDFFQSNAESVEAYTGTLSTIEGYIEKVKDGTFTTADVFTASTELELDTSKIDFNGDWINDFVELIKEDAVEAFELLSEKVGDVDPDYQPVMDELEAMIDQVFNADLAFDSLNSTINNMSGFSDSMKDIKQAYDSLVDGEAVSFDTFKNLSENFGDLPSFDDFVDSVAGASSVTQEIQEAFDRLTTEAIYSSEVMDQIIAQNGEYTEVQKGLLISMLEEVGVINAEAIANDLLGQSIGRLILNKVLLGDATYNLASLTDAQRIAVLNEINALIAEGAQAGLTADQLARLELVKIAINGVSINTSGDIDNLILLAKQAHATAEQLLVLSKAKAAQDLVDMGAVDASNAAQVAADLAAINGVIDDIITNVPEVVTFEGGNAVNYGGSGLGSASGSGGGAEAAAQEIDWVSRKIEILEKKISDFADTTADSYEPWIDRNQALLDSIDATIELAAVQQAAYEEYMGLANEVELPDEYKQLIQEGGDFVEELNDETLNKAIEEYKKYYDQAQDCKDQVEELIHSVKELNSQKLDNLLEQYDSAQDGIESLISIMEWESEQSGIDRTSEISDLRAQQFQMIKEGNDAAFEQLREIYQTGVYGQAAGTVMMGNVAVKAAETKDAFDQYIEELLGTSQMIGDIITQTAELGENSGIFVTFQPLLPDGSKLSPETWRAYLNTISQNGTISSKSALLQADQEGAVIDGQQIQNILMAVVSSLSAIPQQAFSNVNQINFGGTLADTQKSLIDYLKNNLFTDNFLSEQNLEDFDINAILAETVSSFFDSAGLEDGRDVEKVFTDSLEDVLKAIFAEFEAVVAKVIAQTEGTIEDLPEGFEKSEGYVQALTDDLGKVADSVEEAADIASAQIDAIKEKYQDQLDMLDLQWQGATIENKGLVGGGVSLNEQVNILTSQLDIQKAIYEAILQDIMANAEPGSAEYEFAKQALQELQNGMDEIAAKIVEAILDDFNRVVKAYENALGLLEHRANMINLNMELADAQGYMASGVWYEYLIKNSEEELALLQQEKSVLQEKLDAAVDSGYVEVYSEAWYEMQNQINEVDEQILQTTIDIQKFKNEIRQIEWDRFDFLQEKINTLNDEFDFLIQLIENSEDLIDDYGNFTDFGWTSIALYQKQFETYAELVKNYRQEIADLDADFADDPLNKDYIERRQELLEQEREYILSQQEAKNAIIDLIQDAYDQQLEKLQEIIDKKKEALQAEKDLYDYQKKVSDQTKNISNIQKQLAAYAGDDSEEAQKIIQELKVDLDDAMSDLQDTEYDKYLSDQEEMMDRLYTDYEEWIDMRMDDTDALLEDILAQLDEKGSVVEDCLTEITTTWNYDRLIESVESIEQWVQAMFDRADANASEKAEDVWQNTVTQPLDTIYNGETINSIISSVTGSSGGGSGGSGTVSAGGSAGSGTSSSKPSSGPTGPLYENGHSSPSLFAPIYQNNNGDDYSTYGPGSAEYDQMLSQLFNDGYSLEDSKAEFGDTDWYKYAEEFKNKNSYKEGGTLGKLVKYTGEDGIFFGRMGEEIVTPEELDKLSSIFDQADMFKSLRENKNSFPTRIMQNSTNVGDVNFEVVLPNVQNYEDFRKQLIRDPNFEKATLTMVNNAVVGKSSLSKMRYV